MTARISALCCFAFLTLFSVAQAAKAPAWWTDYQAAVEKGDALKAAQGVKFPLSWEYGDQQQIKSQEEFTKNFKTIFNKEVRHGMAVGQISEYEKTGYCITWQVRGNEYSIYFKRNAKGELYLDGLSQGPA